MDFSPYSAAIQVKKSGDIIVNQRFADFLDENNRRSFAFIFNDGGGTCVKERQGLEIRHIELGDKSFFLKKHWQQGLAGPGEGCVEFDEYLAFRCNGLATPHPVACGEKIQGDVLLSFLLTEDFSPLCDLEAIVLNHPEFFRGEENRKKRQHVLTAIARYAQQMHSAGFNQKDFNATHILLADLESDLPKVALFDLQRVDKKILARFMWPIKALSELNYTLPDSIFTEDDKLFLFKKYLGKQKLGFLNHLQYSFIKRKTARIAKHSLKHGLAPKMPTENR